MRLTSPLRLFRYLGAHFCGKMGLAEDWPFTLDLPFSGSTFQANNYILVVLSVTIPVMPGRPSPVYVQMIKLFDFTET
jgi:hypothetical protein